jgi:hypothetical protein
MGGLYWSARSVPAGVWLDRKVAENNDVAMMLYILAFQGEVKIPSARLMRGYQGMGLSRPFLNSLLKLMVVTGSEGWLVNLMTVREVPGSFEGPRRFGLRRL